MLTSFLILGLLFGLCGTIIESVSYSIKHKRLTYCGDKFLYNLPSKPIYAVGGLLLYFSIELTKSFPWYVEILISILIVIIWEYISGVFCTHILKKRFWDYSKRKFNIQGHISWWSAKWWIIFSIIFYFFLYNRLVNFVNYLNQIIKISKQEDLVIFILVIVFVILLTVLKAKPQFSSARDRT